MKVIGKLFKLILWLILIGIVLVAILAFFIFRVPQRIGIIPNAAERHLSATPDRAGAEALLAEARQRGLNTQGINLYVMPYKDYEGSIASVILDAREGFNFNTQGRLGPIGGTFSQIAGGAKAKELGVEQVSMVYISEKGRELMSFAAPRDAITSFANGNMTEEQFMGAIAGDIHLPAVIREQTDQLQRMLK